MIEDIDVLETSYTLPFPIASVVGNFSVTERKGTQLFTQNVAVKANNVSVGESINLQVFADTNAHVSEIQTIITAIKNIEIKPIAFITVADIQTGWSAGDRFTLNRKLDLISIDIIVRSLNFNFENQTTTISGDATLSEFNTER